MLDVLLLVVFTVAGTALAWKGGDYLVSASERLGGHYGLPPVVQGAVIAAVGSSFPELSSTVIATLRYDAFEIGVGAVIGSAVYNILVIPSVSALAGEGRLASNRDLVYKEAQFYLLSLAVLLLAFTLAVLYYPVETTAESLDGRLTWFLALLPMALYGLYVFIQYHDSVDYRRTAVRKRVDVRRQWAILAGALVAILVGAEFLVRAAVGFGELFDTSAFLWGLTVVAAGTSIPDTFVSVAAARVGNASVSLANVFGSNVFALLVALPAGVLVAGTVTVDLATVVPMMTFLVFASVAFFAILRTDMLLTTRESYVLLFLYLVFILWLVAESTGVTGFLP
ncbi:sodium:calcium antiporter [Salinigranum rubrum]|uniref:Sodium:calcium antiporter n=1 Tax=Salinigranum rubrum TaxID=755307 RepID=A0A2I8VPK3_9EURY|nr:sodium:calcium antiporter [Salinigranum rubrum]AUV83049.1 sodium:calcium antiporter [Salinigranum rubrum]